MRKRVALSMRVMPEQGHQPKRDWLSPEWPDFFQRLLPELDWLAVPNQGETLSYNYYREHQIDALILTGGNDIGLERHRDLTEARLLSMAEEHRIPVLGVCRGAQWMVHTLGGKLSACPPEQHAGTTHAVNFIDDWHFEKEAGNTPLENLKQAGPKTRMVNSYHRWGIEASHFPLQHLKPVAVSEDGYIEAFRHRHLPWLGMMWHPERPLAVHVDDMKWIRALFGLENLTISQPMKRETPCEL